jgi:hypothetical protein
LQNKRQTYLVSFVVNVRHQASQRSDQLRPRIGLVSAETVERARELVKPFAQEMGSTFDLEPIEFLDRLEEIPKSVHRYCKTHGYDLIITEPTSEQVKPTRLVFPNCS